MDTNCQRTHRTYRQRGGVYLKLFNLYLRFTNLPCLKLPICFTCKTYLENFQKHRQLILKKKIKPYILIALLETLVWARPLFVHRNCGLPGNRFFFFFNICAITHRRVLQRCVAPPKKKNGCVVDSKTTVQRSTTEKSCTRYLLTCKYFGIHRFNVVTHKGKHESIIWND